MIGAVGSSCCCSRKVVEVLNVMSTWEGGVSFCLTLGVVVVEDGKEMSSQSSGLSWEQHDDGDGGGGGVLTLFCGVEGPMSQWDALASRLCALQ